MQLLGENCLFMHCLDWSPIPLGSMALWLEHGTLTRENPGSNPLAGISKLGQFCLLHFTSVHSAVHAHGQQVLTYLTCITGKPTTKQSFDTKDEQQESCLDGSCGMLTLHLLFLVFPKGVSVGNCFNCAVCCICLPPMRPSVNKAEGQCDVCMP